MNLLLLAAAGAAVLLASGKKKATTSDGAATGKGSALAPTAGLSKSTGKGSGLVPSRGTEPSTGETGTPGESCNAGPGEYAVWGDDGKTCHVYWNKDTFDLVSARLRDEYGRLPAGDKAALCEMHDSDADQWNLLRANIVKKVLLQTYPPANGRAQITPAALPPAHWSDSTAYSHTSPFIKNVWTMTMQVLTRDICGLTG